MSATPAARPSMLSSKLTALVIPTSHNTVIAVSISDDPVHGSVSPQ